MQFAGWTAEGITLTEEQKGMESLTFTMPENAVTLTANYEPIPVPEFTVTVNNGTGSGNYEVGAEVTVTADKAGEGMQFAGWTAEGITLTEEQKGMESLTFTMPENAVTLTANYELVPAKPADKTGLKEMVEKLQDTDGTLYTEESFQAFLQALADAKAILEDETLTAEDQAAVEDALRQLEEAYKALEIKEESSSSEEETSQQPEESQPDTPATGDSPWALWVGIAAMLAAGMGAVLLKKKRTV